MELDFEKLVMAAAMAAAVVFVGMKISDFITDRFIRGNRRHRGR